MERLHIDLFFGQCPTYQIKDCHLKFPKTSTPLIRFSTDSSFESILRHLTQLADKFAYNKDDGRLPHQIIDVNGVVPSIYLRFGINDMLPVQSDSDWAKAMLDAERVVDDDESLLESDDSISQKQMVIVSMLVLVYSPRVKKNKSNTKTPKSKASSSDKNMDHGNYRVGIIAPDYLIVNLLQNVIKNKNDVITSMDTKPVATLKLSWRVFVSNCVSTFSFIILFKRIYCSNI